MFAIAAALADEISGSTAQDMELVLAIEARLDAGEALNDIRADYLEDDEYWADMAAIEEDLGLRDDSDDEDELDDMDLEDQFDAQAESGDRADAQHSEPEEDEPVEYHHVEPLSRDRKADLFDHLLCRIIDEHDCDSGYLIDILRGCDFSDDEVRAALPWLEEDERLAPVGLDRGGATPRDVEYSDGSFGVEQPRWRVYYEGDIFPEDHYVRGSVGITREYWDSSKAHHLYDYCEKHHVPVWLDDTYYCVTEHDGECYC